MKSFLRIILFSTLLFVGGTGIGLAVTSSVPVNLTVQGCNNNGICEAILGEDTLSCPADCHTCTGNDCGGGGGGNYFYNIRVFPDINSATINWQSRYPALATLKWGTNTDYLNGSISGTAYTDTHTAFLNNLLKATKYYFLIEGQNTNNRIVPSYAGTFTTLSGVDPTKPPDVQNFTATPNNRLITITLTWTNPTVTNFEYVRIMRNNATGNTSPMLGTLIYEGNREYFVDTDVFIFTRYFYTIFVRDTEGNFSEGVEANAIINPIVIDPCILNPTSCIPPPDDPCLLNPSLCNPPIDPCLATPSPCVPPPPKDPCILNPSLCLPPDPILPPILVPPPDSVLEHVVGVGPTIAVGLSALLSGGAILLSSSLAFGEIWLVLLRLWSLLMIALGLKKRTPPWGVIYDSVTKQPLDPAYVVLMNEKGEEVASCITDIDGRYGFSVEPGKYTIIASKANYSYPSIKLAGRLGDELYGNLYFGTEIEVTESGAILAKNIPLDPLNFDWNEFAKKDQHLLKFFKARDIWLGRLSNILFWVGSIFSIYAVLVSPTGYNIAIVSLSAFIYLMRILGFRAPSKGSVLAMTNRQPLPFSIVRVHGIETGQEISHRVTDRTGRYYALLPNGKYTVTIDKKNMDESYTKISLPDSVLVTKGYLKKDFKI